MAFAPLVASLLFCEMGMGGALCTLLSKDRRGLRIREGAVFPHVPFTFQARVAVATL